MNTTIIAGAGMAGLVIGHELARNGRDVVIVERNHEVGGLARSFTYDGFVFDIGPHRFFTEDPQVSDFITNILKDQMVKIGRKSGVYFQGAYHSWPLHPSMLLRLPIALTVRSLRDLFSMSHGQDIPLANFEEYIRRNYGSTLYDTFFKAYTRKFLGLSPEMIHADWARLSMQRAVINDDFASANLLNILFLMLHTIFEQPAHFIYPARGMSQFCTLLADAVQRCGGSIMTGSAVTEIRMRDDTVVEVTSDGQLPVTPGRLVWTGSLEKFCAMGGTPCGGLRYRSLLVYNFALKKRPRHEYQWCYFGDPDIVFSRVTLPYLFSTHMAPPGRFSLCAEIACTENDDHWRDPGSLTGRIVDDLQRTGLIASERDIEFVRIEKVPDAYPLYTLGYHQELKSLNDRLSRVRNLTFAGRSGLFWYNNMDESIRNGLDTSERLLR